MVVFAFAKAYLLHNAFCILSCHMKKSATYTHFTQKQNMQKALFFLKDAERSVPLRFAAAEENERQVERLEKFFSFLRSA